MLEFGVSSYLSSDCSSPTCSLSSGGTSRGCLGPNSVPGCAECSGGTSWTLKAGFYRCRVRALRWGPPRCHPVRGRVKVWVQNCLTPVSSTCCPQVGSLACLLLSPGRWQNPSLPQTTQGIPSTWQECNASCWISDVLRRQKEKTCKEMGPWVIDLTHHQQTQFLILRPPPPPPLIQMIF